MDAGLNAHTITESAELLDQRNDSDQCGQVMRIVAGMCLYMQSLPPSSPYVSPWQAADQDVLSYPDAIVADQAMVCAVSTQFRLTPEEKGTFNEHTRETMAGNGGSAHIRAPHFRQGFWHRPRGKGGDPLAKKSEWTRPTIVNKDMLKDGELPKGADVIMLSGLSPNSHVRPE